MQLFHRVPGKNYLRYGRFHKNTLHLQIPRSILCYTRKNGVFS